MDYAFALGVKQDVLRVLCTIEVGHTETYLCLFKLKVLHVACATFVTVSGTVMELTIDDQVVSYSVGGSWTGS